nr:MAG TPA: hypothetical protein [Caudoviricetes sp.]
MQALVQASPPPPQRRRGLAAATPTITPVCCGFTVAVFRRARQYNIRANSVFAKNKYWAPPAHNRAEGG